MLLSFKTALIPNNRQITAFRKASGVARHAYNWANAQIIDILATRKEGEKLKLPSHYPLPITHYPSPITHHLFSSKMFFHDF